MNIMKQCCGYCGETEYKLTDQKRLTIRSTIAGTLGLPTQVRHLQRGYTICEHRWPIDIEIPITEEVNEYQAGISIRF